MEPPADATTTVIGKDARQHTAALTDDSPNLDVISKEVHESDDVAVASAKSYKKDYRFWAILFALCITSLLASLENTVVVTSLPTIVEKLNFGSSYVWVANAFFLTSASVQPLFGQLSNLFGRRYLTIFIVALFTLGSGGAGSGGINMIIDVIISDLVPLRDRGYYMAIILATYGIGTAIGPIVGGIIVQTTSWRWVFYINLPVGGLSMVLLYLFLHVKWDRTSTFREKIRRIDFIGNSILIASTVSVLIALTWAGSVHPWSSYHVLLPLILGLLGLIGFCLFERSGLAPEPVMPLRLFGNRTSAVVYGTTFLNSAMLYWAFFFLPLYFQAVKLSTPGRSGVQLLPVTLISIPGAAISAVVLARWGRYKALHISGFALMTAGFGIWSVLNRDSGTAAWVLVQMVPAVGSGFLMNTLLPAFQAGLEEKDQAAATASWSFIRSFGNIWGVAIPAAIFNTYVSKYAGRIDDAVAREVLSGGDAYASATKTFVESFPSPVRDQIIEVFTEALKRVFWICMAFGGLAFAVSFFEKEVKLRKELETDHGVCKVMKKYRVKKPSGPHERKGACDCRRRRDRQRSQSSSSVASLMSQSSPGTVASKITTPGDLNSTPGSLEPLPHEITTAFFAFVGDSPSPLTDVFSQSFIKTYLDTSIPVRAIVTTFGKVLLEYGRKVDLPIKQAAANALVAADRPKLNEFLDVLTSSECHDQHVTLLYGILLAYLETMVARSWLLYQGILRKLSDKIREQLKRERRRPHLYFDRGLLINFSLHAGYHALISFEDTFLVDVELYDPSPFADIDTATSHVRTNAAILHHYCRYVANFARLHHRATKWVRQARQVIADRQSMSEATVDELRQTLASFGLLQTGKEVVESSARVIDVMEMFRGSGDDNDEDIDGSDFGYMRAPLYHFALMGLTRTFWDPTWKLIDNDLPNMHDMPNLEAHALFVLERLEQRIPLLGLESWSYLVIMMGVAMEVRMPEYQKRVEALVKSVAEKGFACAESMLGDMKLLWGVDYALQHDISIGPSS
ncbi:hypothetical protein CkaCkLH20_07990 [Colletotrichum karsti]|uniref:Major facilitator superfamily (MFS) profile domain-containing protein n=1 Tax=Colletotrichum karsti TaxID=1095194 RepID=A0A9P6LJB8_9PEZI|nr:uncharacterized protein CkaCkLH20_07990 [Colletotrichum karsti]KAF9874427.1 hypothetical protein CkaCkLH20_07990 [Colletotrichum karsti]